MIVTDDEAKELKTWIIKKLEDMYVDSKLMQRIDQRGMPANSPLRTVQMPIQMYSPIMSLLSYAQMPQSQN